jgi:pyruvate/2-oxoglutarate dehydrogenase complex dihydrolipoamide acyltransferase (E2) component
VRRALLWWFGWPANPYVTVNFAVDFSTALAYLDGLGVPRVPVGALVAAAIGRVLSEHPQANARVVGGRIVHPGHVGIAMPVNLLGHPGEARRELAVAIVERVESRSLREVAEASRATVSAERTGAPQNAFIRRLLGVVEGAPQPVVDRTLGLLDRAMGRASVAARIYDRVPLTTALSNAGAAIEPAPGMLFRGADVAIPQRIVHIGTFWGLSAVQDEVIAVDGVPTVRPMLPVLFLFDHRLIDGVLGARVATRMATILRDPAAVFGATGDRRPG